MTGLLLHLIVRQSVDVMSERFLDSVERLAGVAFVGAQHALSLPTAFARRAWKLALTPVPTLVPVPMAVRRSLDPRSRPR